MTVGGDVSRRELGLGALAGLVLGGSKGRELGCVTVILVRHAEKTDAADDPELSEPGRSRAVVLADLLGHAGVTHVFTTDYRRTRQTVAPLAESLEIEPTIYGARDTAAFAERVGRLESGAVAFVAGHSNTVPAIARALGGRLAGLDDRGFLAETEYDRLVIVTLCSVGDAAPARAVQTLDLRMPPRDAR